MNLKILDAQLRHQVDPAWHTILQCHTLLWQELLLELQEIYQAEAHTRTSIYPSMGQVFQAFSYVLPQQVRVIILGQDPYHGGEMIEGVWTPQAHGLAFSVQKGIRVPPSLKNMYQELKSSGCIETIPTHGCLTSWAQQGVLLLNSALTVEQHRANSHAHIWQKWSQACTQALAATQPYIWLLWGKYAQQHAENIMASGVEHVILQAPHPSPLSAYRGFLGCGHFMQSNAYLAQGGFKPIDWRVMG